MSSFDIRKLLDFKPAEYHCLKCCALLNFSDVFRYPAKQEEEAYLACPICQVKYLPSDDYERYQWGVFMEGAGCAIKFENLIRHSRQLGAIAKGFYEYPGIPPIRSLLQAINSAQHFIHFTTWGISYIMIGALKLAAQRIKVRGIVSLSQKEERIRSELEDYKNETPTGNFEIYCPSVEGLPHQKLIIIDGLFAFKGSANLTDMAWRKAGDEKKKEMVEVATDVSEVIKLNNRFFAPVWAEREGEMEEIIMNEDVPF